VIVVDSFAYEAPSTKQMLALLAAAGVAEQKVLVLTDGVKSNVFLSARNIPTAHVMPYTDASTYHILWSDVVVIEGAAIGQTLEPVAETAPATPVKAPRAPKAVAKAKATEAAPKVKRAKKAAPKTTED
jgi:hypothetical protein